MHGGVRLDRHQAITADLMRELRCTQPLDLAHLPREVAPIEAFRERFPAITQVACLDTVFTRGLPRVAQICRSRCGTSKPAFGASGFMDCHIFICWRNCGCRN
jgi:acetate kinase